VCSLALSESEHTLRSIATLAVMAVITAVSIAFTSAAAVTAAGQMPSVQSVSDAQDGGFHWWRVGFSNGVICDVPRPLTATLAGSKPATGAVTSFNDDRLVVAGVRLWGAVLFTDAAGTRHACY